MMFIKLGKRYQKGFTEGFKTGYNMALHRVEAQLHAEIRFLNKTDAKTSGTKLRIKQIDEILVKVKGLYR